MSTLIVLLPAGAPTPSTEWSYVLTPDGRQAARQGSAVASLLPQPERPAEVVAVVPVRCLSWHPIELPRGIGPASPRLQAVLEGLLEDRLLDEPAQLHLALGPAPGPEQTRWVAACDRAWLSSTLQALEAAGRSVTRIVPELWPEARLAADSDGDTVPCLRALGPADAGEWVLCGLDARQPVLRQPMGRTGHPVWPQRPEHTALLAEPAVAAQAETALGRPVVLETPASRWLAAAASPWELAQQGFASTQRHRLLKLVNRGLRTGWQSPAWRAARLGLGLLLLAQWLGLNAWAWKEDHNLVQRQAEINSMLTRSFPNVRVVVDAPVQMAREVANLRQASGQASGGDLETLLQAATRAAPAGKLPSGLDYAGGELRLKGMNLGSDEMLQFGERLHGQGYAARQEADQIIVRQEVR